MSDERQSWERMPDESALWFGRFERYRLMWPHNIAEVYRDEWRTSRQRGEKPGTEETRGSRRIDATLEQDIPKEAPGPWYEAAKRWQWEERAAAWDAAQIAEIERGVTAEKAKVLLTGYAAMYRRVATLNEMAERLFTMTKDPDKVWMPDVKAVGTGEFAERVDLVTFNAPLFNEIRACFADIAAELGERVKKKEITVKELPPDSYAGITEDDEGSEP